MGVNAGSTAAAILGGGFLKADKRGNVQPLWEGTQGKNAGQVIGSTFLGLATAGTSNISTNGGQYGDETVADSLFPKTANDLLLDRNASRAATDKATRDAAIASQPGPPPDMADAILKNKMSGTLTGQGRRSAFLTGAMGDVTSPLVPKKSGVY